MACNISGDKSMIKKRYMYLTEEILKEHPNICAYMAPSLDARQDMVVVEITKLGKEAIVKAIKEWGWPKSKITYLVFCTTSGVDMPGADYQLTKLLGLCPFVKRLMMYQQGCFAGGTVLCLAKDLAENNKGACVLIVCLEIIAVTFHGPNDAHLDSLVGQYKLWSTTISTVSPGPNPKSTPHSSPSPVVFSPFSTDFLLMSSKINNTQALDILPNSLST
ncbi:hypothetical protein FH972_014897 [Carpinus fangiana]|uniref:Chalcone/stilbene synthase N-terminal domain-containing protein n=1 Tax=Carpinus fangiana TaxID=176857 RepID=A0A5N6RC57_9ROSI|nr:hypothetical protein FH972_014897 [Carpinus fangiana]